MAAAFAALFSGADIYLAMAAALAAGLLRGFAGFGSAMLMAPLFAILFGSAEMIATIVAMELAISFHLFPAARRHCDWAVVAPMTVAACLAMPLGVWLLVNLDKTMITKLVSAVVAGFAVIMLAGWRWRGARGWIPSAAVGTISGAMMATTSVGGPPVLLYIMSSDDSPATVRANVITYYFATQILLLGIMFAGGVAGPTALFRATVLFPFMLAGSWVGVRFFHGASEVFYRRVALGVLLAVGIFGLVR
jgi:uncharacterized protein